MKETKLSPPTRSLLSWVIILCSFRCKKKMRTSSTENHTKTVWRAQVAAALGGNSRALILSHSSTELCSAPYGWTWCPSPASTLLSVTLSQRSRGSGELVAVLKQVHSISHCHKADTVATAFFTALTLRLPSAHCWQQWEQTQENSRNHGTRISEFFLSTIGPGAWLHARGD